jgi:NAD(P)-dependent dehydrogenase (short-subunit alcohol dehydrogenase family)
MSCEQVALITGGASGIGESTARYFAARDAAVLVVDVAQKRWLERDHGGSIINIASIAGMHGEPGAGAYSVSKHGVIGLTRVLAATYGPMGIRCNAISPGSVRTPLFDRWLENMNGESDLLQRLEGIYPLRRLMQPDKIASTIYFVASDAASAINGVNLPVDGGLTATIMEQAVL